MEAGHRLPVHTQYGSIPGFSSCFIDHHWFSRFFNSAGYTVHRKVEGSSSRTPGNIVESSNGTIHRRAKSHTIRRIIKPGDLHMLCTTFIYPGKLCTAGKHVKSDIIVYTTGT